MVEAIGISMPKESILETKGRITIQLSFESSQFMPPPIPQQQEKIPLAEQFFQKINQQTKRITQKNTYEIFENVDPKKTRLQDIIEMLQKQRDFSEAGVHTMLKQQGISTNKLISFNVQILLFPPQRDLDPSIAALYDSDIPSPQLTIAQEIANTGDLLEGNFLELHCEVLIEL